MACLHSQCCTTNTIIHLQNLLIFLIGNSLPVKHQLSIPCPPAPSKHSGNLLSVSMDFTTLGTSRKRNHTIFVLPWLAHKISFLSIPFKLENQDWFVRFSNRSAFLKNSFKIFRLPQIWQKSTCELKTITGMYFFTSVRLVLILYLPRIKIDYPLKGHFLSWKEVGLQSPGQELLTSGTARVKGSSSSAISVLAGSVCFKSLLW